MSSASSANPLADYLAGRLTAEQLVAAVTTTYWSQEPGAKSRGKLQPIIEVIERAHPGIVELSGSGEKPGFAVKLAERPFPKRFDGDLRKAVQAIVNDPSLSPPTPRSRLQTPGLFTRIFRAIRKIFSA